MTNQQVLRAENVSLAYGKRPVLAGINLNIGQGEFWFFLGPNGEGKSTFLKALLGMERPEKGSIKFFDEFSTRDRIGYVPQRCDLNPTLPTTVEEFILLGLVGIKCTPIEEKQRLSWALAKVGLSDNAQTNYWSLSGGQRQRVLVARALVRRPHLLITDEPTNGLDVTSETRLLHDLHHLNQHEKLTLIFVTHQISLAWRYATHVAIFHDGRVESGRREKILTGENLSRIYDLPIEDFHAILETAHL